MTPGNFTQEFHQFVLEWEPGEMRWYVDGGQMWRVTDSTVAKTPMFLVYSLQVGGAWWIGNDGDPNSSTPFPSYLEADYIRVYRR